MTDGYRAVAQIMGMLVSLHLADPVGDGAALAGEVFDWLRRVDALFSTYRDDSEISRLDRGALDPADASADVRAVLARCAGLRAETGGYFDVYATGRLDPSGYVKGWAVQVASDRLVAAGAQNHFLSAGGDVRVRGEAGPGRAWRVGVEHPWRRDRLAWVLECSDLAVATSGTAARGGHVRDPYTKGASRGLRSVTVTGPDLGEADALSTAALAMGRAGIDWLAGLTGYGCAVVADDGAAFTSPGFAAG
ncbi:FAD:protein FMN transferase [Longispora sp. K20-0274]|uniref:FAD:protein FMN transferase n=1 Tax=Longispora sp. K20-0274 TaxID=3088255 RepID=UPI0039996380